MRNHLSGCKPIIFAAKVKNTEMVQLLLQHGADPNFDDCKRNNALLYAAEVKNTEMVQLLLQHGADPNEYDCQRNTPLDYAYNRGDMEMTDLLVQYGARVTAMQYFGGLMYPNFGPFYKENMKLTFLSSLHNPDHNYDRPYSIELKKIREMPNLNKLIEANKNKTNVISEYINNEDQWKELIQELRIIKRNSTSDAYEGLQNFVEHLITNHYERKHNKDRNLIENNGGFLGYFLRKISNVVLVLDKIDEYMNDRDRNNVFLAYRRDIIDRSCSNQKMEVTMEFKQDMSKVDKLLTELKEVEPVSKFQSCTIL